MKKEKDVKAAVSKIFKKHAGKVWYFMPVSYGMGKAGVPDFVACIGGTFLTVETKFGRNGLSPMQIVQIDAIRQSGGIHLTVDEDTYGMVETTVLGLLAMQEGEKPPVPPVMWIDESSTFDIKAIKQKLSEPRPLVSQPLADTFFSKLYETNKKSP